MFQQKYRCFPCKACQIVQLTSCGACFCLCVVWLVLICRELGSASPPSRIGMFRDKADGSCEATLVGTSLACIPQPDGTISWYPAGKTSFILPKKASLHDSQPYGKASHSGKFLLSLSRDGAGLWDTSQGFERVPMVLGNEDSCKRTVLGLQWGGKWAAVVCEEDNTVVHLMKTSPRGIRFSFQSKWQSEISLCAFPSSETAKWMITLDMYYSNLVEVYRIDDDEVHKVDSLPFSSPPAWFCPFVQPLHVAHCAEWMMFEFCIVHINMETGRVLDYCAYRIQIDDTRSGIFGPSVQFSRDCRHALIGWRCCFPPCLEELDPPDMIVLHLRTDNVTEVMSKAIFTAAFLGVDSLLTDIPSVISLSTKTESTLLFPTAFPCSQGDAPSELFASADGMFVAAECERFIEFWQLDSNSVSHIADIDAPRSLLAGQPNLFSGAKGYAFSPTSPYFAFQTTGTRTVTVWYLSRSDFTTATNIISLPLTEMRTPLTFSADSHYLITQVTLSFPLPPTASLLSLSSVFI